MSTTLTPEQRKARRVEIARQAGIKPLALLFGLYDVGRPDPADDPEPVPPTAVSVLSSPARVGVAVSPARAGLGLSPSATATATAGKHTQPPAAGLTRPTVAPRRIGTDPTTGERMTVPDDPAPEPLPPPPPVRGASLSDPIDAWMSDRDLAEQLAVIETEHRLLGDQLAALGEEREGEAHDTWQRRQTAYSRLGRVSERYAALSDERSRRFMQHIDRVAVERESAHGPRLVVGWPLPPRS